MIKLIGILVMAVGFAFRVNTLVVVLAAGFATAWAADIAFHDLLAQFGALFVENRYMTMPVVLLLPLVGLLERHGLQTRAEQLIQRTRAATAGRVILLYSVVRQVSISLGVRIGDHASMVRPLVVPMAEAAALRQRGQDVDEAATSRRARRQDGDVPAPGQEGDVPAPGTALTLEQRELIRAHAAAGENVGNFFGEDIFIAVGAVLLMGGFFESVGMRVSLWAIALWGIPTAFVAFGLMWWRVRVLDRRLVADARGKGGP